MSKAISRRNFLMATGAVGAAGLLAACGSKPAASSTASSAASQAPAASADESLALSDGPVSMTISWWGGDSRHAAYQSALEAFQAEHSNITVEPTFAAWSGWEEKMAAAFIAGNAQDVCQVNWNWLYNYSADGSKFVDLNTVSKFLDLTQWDAAAMDACYVANSQQCVPVSMTGRIFFWNMTTFNKAGITEVPTTWDAFLADCEAIKANGISPVYYSGVDTWTLQFFALMGWYSDYAPEDAQAFADAMSTNQKHWSDMNGFIDSIGKIKELVDLGYVQETYLSDTYQQAQQALLDGTCAFYAQGAEVASFDDPAFREVMTFMQEKVLQKIDSANFGPGGDDDEQYRNDFFDGKTAMLFNGVWDAGGSVDCAAGAENIKPANFPTNESGKRASLMSGGTGFVVSNSLTDAQTAACIEFIKYMTSEEIANKIIAFGIGMAPNTNVDYATLMDSVDAPEAKLLVSACQLCMAADYQALGLGNEFGDFEGEIQAKYAGLKDGSKTVDDVVSELDAVIAAN